MLTRYPDKPILSAPAILDTLVPSEWSCQVKLDGWRAVIQIEPDDRASFTSRHNKPLPVSPAIVDQIERLHLPPGTILDGEWLTMRRGQPEGLAIFDVLQFDNCWLGNFSMFMRWAKLIEIIPPRLLIERCWKDFAKFFERMRSVPGAEGVVLKRLDSHYIGSCRGSSVLNPNWIKVKF